MPWSAEPAVSFFAPGTPVPGGSKKAFVNPKTGRAIVTDAAGQRNKEWRAVVALSAERAMEPFLGIQSTLLTGPLRAFWCFHLIRPKAHYGTGRNAHKLKLSAPRWPAKIPDTTKLVRAAEDACTGVIWRDDAQIVDQHALKCYADRSGLRLEVWTWEGGLEG